MNKTEYLTQGFRQFGQKEYRDAIDSFMKAIELDENFEAAYNALAETHAKLGELDKAIVIAKKLIEINSGDPLAHTTLSRLYVQKGMINEAETEMAISQQLAMRPEKE